jgi:putative membrane protein
MMWGPFGMMMGPLFMILIIAAVILLIRWLVPWTGHMAGHMGSHSGPPTHTALNILRERFARGEIDKTEFEERRRVLGE